MGVSTDIMTIYGWMAGPDEAPRGAIEDGCDYWYGQFPLDEEGHVMRRAPWPGEEPRVLTYS